MSGKKMTAREKKLRADFKKKLQAEGKLPPDKPKLNRKKYVEEARAEWNGRDAGCFIWDLRLYQAISITLCLKDKNFRTSPEAIGVAKTLKLAMRLKEFGDKLKEEGRTEYTYNEQYEYIKDILEA